MRIVRSSETFEDLVEIAEYLGADDPAVAHLFFDCYETTLSTIKRNPKIGVPRRSRTGDPFRIWFVKKFEKVLILYRETKEEVRILRVIHSARNYTRFI